MVRKADARAAAKARDRDRARARLPTHRRDRSCIGLALNTRHVFLIRPRVEQQLSTATFAELVRRRVLPVFRHIRSIDMPDVIMERFYEDWMRWTLEHVPFRTLVRILDSYMLEGSKVFYRSSLALVAQASAELVRSNTLDEAQGVMDRAAAQCTVPDPLLQRAFRLQLSRKMMMQIYERFRATRSSLRPHIGSSAAAPAGSAPDGQTTGQEEMYFPKLQIQSELLTEPDLRRLWPFLPARYRILNLLALYLSDAHGYSLRTLYARCGDHAPLLLVVRSTRSYIFGAFVSHPWSERRGDRAFFGNGECFLFRLRPQFRYYAWVGKDAGLETLPDGSEYFLMGSDRELVVGGGGCGHARGAARRSEHR